MFFLLLITSPLSFKYVSSLAMPSVVPLALFLVLPVVFPGEREMYVLNPIYYLWVGRKYKIPWNSCPACVVCLPLAMVHSETLRKKGLGLVRN